MHVAPFATLSTYSVWGKLDSELACLSRDLKAIEPERISPLLVLHLVLARDGVLWTGICFGVLGRQRCLFGIEAVFGSLKTMTG